MYSVRLSLESRIFWLHAKTIMKTYSQIKLKWLIEKQSYVDDLEVSYMEPLKCVRPKFNTP